MTAFRISLDDKYAAEHGVCLMSGIHALVRLPLDQARLDGQAGLRTGGFISGYRGSPLGGYDQQLKRAKHFLDAHNIRFQPCINEDLAATAVWGSQQVNLHPGAKVDGVFGIWYGKTPGVDRSGDVFKHANMTGTWPHGGVLAIAGDDPLAKSSTLPSQSEFAFLDAEIPILAPANIQELLDLGLHGIAMSRFSGLWVGMIAMAEIMDGSATVNVDPARLGLVTPPDDGRPRHITLAGLKLQNRHGLEERMRLFKLPAAKLYARYNRLNRIVWNSAQPRLGIFVSGKNWQATTEALRLLGIDDDTADRLGIRLVKLSMPWPLDEEDISTFAGGLQNVLVVEAKRPLIEAQLKEHLYHLPADQRPTIMGKADRSGAPLLGTIGDLHAEEIALALAKLLPDRELTEAMSATVLRIAERRRQGHALGTHAARTPFFCSGCPHNSSTRIPDGSRAMAGIGCHIMAQAVDGRAEDAYSQMGGEGVAWLGQTAFTETGHIFVNLGDGTYHHSGSLAIRAAVAAKANITYKILYNDAVAMTGGQPVDGPIGVAEITRQLAAESVRQIAVVAEDPSRHVRRDLATGVTVHPRDDLDAVQRQLRDTAGVTVLIFDQTCAAEKRRRRKRGEYPTPAKRLFINERVCEGCGDCSAASNCISVEPLETGFGTKRRINQSSCNFDFSCAKGFCPSFVEVEGVSLKKSGVEHGAIIGAAANLSAPPASKAGQGVKILLTGIGGTGVTTASAVLAMAAHIDGCQAASLDVTGLAQKGGAVLSHLAIAPAGAAAPVARIGAGEADCVIAGDLVVAAGSECLTMCDPERTVAVADEDIPPTAEFVLHGSQGYRTSRPHVRLRKSVREFVGHPIGSMAEALLGDTIYANMMLVGAAYQLGHVPLSLVAIEQAIALNGVAVEANRAAFQGGRLLVAQPGALKAFLPGRPVTQPETINELIVRLGNELAAYQDEAYASRYRHTVDSVRTAETALSDGASQQRPLRLTEAVARNLFKLMAYKDEYEVARLYSDAAFKARLASTFDGTPKLKVLLAPPLLARTDPATGRPKKIAFGPWVFGAFRLLAKLKRLRGSAFDPFGWSQERRAERQLIAEYEATIEAILPRVTRSNLATAVTIAELPDGIRGFGPVKMQRIAEVMASRLKLLAEFYAHETVEHGQGQSSLIAAE
jgi:indolepyruvate ferredoxin oxidoreductase